MTLDILCRKLTFDQEVTKQVLAFEPTIDYTAIQDILSRLLCPDTWDDAIKQLEAYCGEDKDGIKILTICLHCLLSTYDNYFEKGIPESIFWDTMGFLPRFLQSHKETEGYYAFRWAWWFPRQLSMNEYRIGEYEYEFVKEEGICKINIHIPSDARLAQGNIAAIYPFVEKYYPEYKDAAIYCDSWLLSPALPELLPPSSNIIHFQKQFELLKIEADSPYFMDWIYSRLGIAYEDLPENTSLQRNVKRYLLAGGKVGTAYGVYRADML